jgi:RimJ/RimL family protein N-acetyltransferase
VAGPKLETGRLILREMVPEDRDVLFDILGDPWTMRYYPRPFTELEVEAWVARWRQSFERNRYGLWGLVLKESGQLIGDTGLSLQVVDDEPLPEVGWHVHRDFQRQGYATEAARASLDYGFGDLGLSRIISLIRPENEPSWRVAEKLGMRAWKETDHAHLLHRVHVLDRRDWIREPQ